MLAEHPPYQKFSVRVARSTAWKTSGRQVMGALPAPPMEQTSVVGDLGFDVGGGVPPTTDLVEVESLEVFEIFGLEDDVDAAPLVVHGSQPNNRLRGPWDKG